jgi:hypothetical protein
LPNIEYAASSGIALVGTQFASQFETEKILRQHQAYRPAKRLSLKLLQPIQGGNHKSRRGCGPASLREQWQTNALFDFGQQVCAALVGPNDRRPQQALGPIEQHQPMHLAGEANAQNLWVTCLA